MTFIAFFCINNRIIKHTFDRDAIINDAALADHYRAIVGLSVLEPLQLTDNMYVIRIT
jgi:hypothetical protein